jgi:hypothetical protein
MTTADRLWFAVYHRLLRFSHPARPRIDAVLCLQGIRDVLSRVDDPDAVLAAAVAELSEADRSRLRSALRYAPPAYEDVASRIRRALERLEPSA